MWRLRLGVHVLGHRMRALFRRRLRIIPGQTLDLEVSAPGGVIEATAETRIEGTTLVISEVAIYRRGTTVPLRGLPATGSLLREARRLEEAACALDCDRVRIEAHRSYGSSAARPGRRVQFEWRIRCRRN